MHKHTHTHTQYAHIQVKKGVIDSRLKQAVELAVACSHGIHFGSPHLVASRAQGAAATADLDGTCMLHRYTHIFIYIFGWRIHCGGEVTESSTTLDGVAAYMAETFSGL